MVVDIRTPKNRRGQSLVEIGLTLMLILWLLSAAVDFGMGLFSYVAIRDAAQEGALYGSICQSQGLISARVRASSTRPVNMASTSVNVSLPSGAAVGNPLTVSVNYAYRITTPLVTIFIGAPTISLRASATSTILKLNFTCH